ncbi:MAG: hypothetical protein PHC70_05355 [Patescibacteria group bacterium]|jgi:hypothetical protein|nr:hypothetical protein [Patescibacteria group bacterium]
MNLRLKSTCFAAIATALILPGMVLAQSVGNNPFNQARDLTNSVGQKAGIANQQSLPSMIGSIINVALGFLGILLLFYMLYAGFLWMTAGGDEKKVQKATSIIQQAIVGLLIIVAAFAVSNFVLGSLINVSYGTP